MKLRKIYTSAGILLLSLFCIGDAVAKDAKFETGVSFGSTGADEPYSSLTDKDGNYYISGMCRGDVEFAGGATIKGRGGMDAVIVNMMPNLIFCGQEPWVAVKTILSNALQLPLRAILSLSVKYRVMLLSTVRNRR